MHDEPPITERDPWAPEVAILYDAPHVRIQVQLYPDSSRVLCVVPPTGMPSVLLMPAWVWPWAEA